MSYGASTLTPPEVAVAGLLINVEAVRTTDAFKKLRRCKAVGMDIVDLSALLQSLLGMLFIVKDGEITPSCFRILVVCERR